MPTATTRSAVRSGLRAVAVAAAAAAALPLLAAPASAAGGPVLTTLDRTFVSRVLTEACGVPVVQHLWGTFSTVVHGDRTITNFRFRSTLTAGDNVVDSRTFGPTIEVRNADGSLTVTQLGVQMRNVPGTGAAGPFAGRKVTTIVLDEHGEVVEERVESSVGFAPDDHAELCAALTA